MSIGVYLESWAVPWSPSLNNDIVNLDTNLNTVYLAFAYPGTMYTKGELSFARTGLNFSLDFEVVVDSIKALKKRGVTVYLSVGGGSYWSEPKAFNHFGCIDLMNDLGCDGICLDWEVGITDDIAPVNAISALYPHMQGKLINFTCFSTGAFAKSLNDKYRGMNLKTLKICKSYINQVNVMAYDAGKDFDAIAAFESYRELYDGPINLGFEIGKHGWGDGLLFKEELVKNLEYVKKSFKDGCFFWAYYSKEYNGSISAKDAFATAYSVLKPVYTPPPKPPLPPPPKPTYSCPSSVFIMCPTCKTKIKNSWSI